MKRILVNGEIYVGNYQQFDGSFLTALVQLVVPIRSWYTICQLPDSRVRALILKTQSEILDHPAMLVQTKTFLLTPNTVITAARALHLRPT